MSVSPWGQGATWALGPTVVECDVYGWPKTKGSLAVRNRRTGTMRESVVDSGAWRRLVADAAKAWRVAHGLTHPCPNPVVVKVEFWLPTDRTPAGRGASPEHRMFGTWAKAGDIDKLLRNVLDALGCTGPADARAILDDELVCGVGMAKRGVIPGITREAGAHILVVDALAQGVPDALRGGA